MTIYDAASYLTRFDAPPPIALQQEKAVDVAVEFETAGSQRDDMTREAEREAMRVELEAQLRSALQEERQAYEQRLQAARAQWTSQAAEQFSHSIIRAFDNAFEALREDISATLAPFVSREIAVQALDEAIMAARTALADESSPAIALRGPKDLLDKMRKSLVAAKIAVTAQESDDVDIRIDMAKTRIETRLGDWMRRLSDEGIDR